MNYRWKTLTLSLLAGLFAIPGHAAAQDVRDIRPVVMLMLDTSGSMERRPSCECLDEACTNCLPSCLSTDPAMRRNKWATVLEALTGPWNDFQCTEVERPSDAFDAGYPIPHYSHPAMDDNQGVGILDAYADRVKFGMMTFDAEPTLLTDSPLVLGSAFHDPTYWSRSRGEEGMYSYGPDRTALPDPTSSVEELASSIMYYGFPDCGDAHMIDNGARNASSPMGPPVSVGSEDDETEQLIQLALLGGEGFEDIRPYGPTPIAGMFADLDYYMNNSVDVSEGGDPMFSCRPRYAILITDGRPNADMREDPFNCELGQGLTPGADGANPYDCPYPRPEETVAELCNADANGQCTGALAGIFVVGLDVNDDEARETLNDIARAGGTGEAVFASDSESLFTELSGIMSRLAITVTSRTAPAFTNGTRSHSQFNTGFRQAESGPWEGLIERRRFACDSQTGLPEPQQVTDDDRFHQVISSQSTRTLFTVLPSDPCNLKGHLLGADAQDSLYGTSVGGPANGNGNGSSSNDRGNGTAGNGGRNDTCGDPNRANNRSSNAGGPNNTAVECPARSASEDQVTESTFTCGNGNNNNNNNTSTGEPVETDLGISPINGSLDPAYLGDDATADTVDEVVAFLTGADRDNELGAIEHSSPVIVGPPEADLADESYNLFRRRDEVANRPEVMYVGTNDGILHAIAAEDFTDPDGNEVEAGTELWGFVAPLLFPRLRAASATNVPMADATPVVRDIFFRRLPGADPDGSIWHSVLITGFRRGGAGYVALDVTDPLNPEFLWQFSHPELGKTYGTPALAQILVADADGNLEERAIALLPGGAGDDLTNLEGCGKCYLCDNNGDGDFEDTGEQTYETPSPEEIEDGTCVLNEPIGCPTNGLGMPPANDGTVNAREQQRCWGTAGRQLFIVDPFTGELVTSLDDKVFGAPVTGGISTFPGEVGTIAQAAYVTDADGFIYRIDMTDTDISQWGANRIFDIFGGDMTAFTDSQPAFESPILTTDPLGNVVIIQSTGNIDVFDAAVRNRVVSITENLSVDCTGVGCGDNGDTGVSAELGTVGTTTNWILVLEPSEQVTGPMELFAGGLFFGSFVGAPDLDNQCAAGVSRIWGVHYLSGVNPNETDETGTENSTGECLDPDIQQVDSSFDPLVPEGILTGVDGALDRGRCLGPFENQVIMGVGIAERPSCATFDEPSIDDPFVGTRTATRAQGSSGSNFELVAQVSGSGASVPGAVISDTSTQLAPPVQYTRATASYAGRAE